MTLPTFKVKNGDVTPRTMVGGKLSDGSAVAHGAVLVNSACTNAGDVSANGALYVRTAADYESVAASATAQVLGATGATSDYIERIIITPATTSPGAVALLDGSTSYTLFAGGSTSVASLAPITINLGIYSTTGPWKISTGTNISVLAIGDFT